ncbi:Gfo/Idh/MocA family protein [Cohnella sp. GbtcB17]|uniref:Gfo/Idh/MocA family protein n=1 Tax=Cohnella sp. GbtcB17 TaxID=2824762 RepID=UPI001C30B4D5|nr:Gfo/Idh/MocA family oxidoreductase [Cohnella sp. GbtcB17]
MTTVKLGLIGLGGMAGVHVGQLAGIAGVRLAAVCDQDAAKVEQWAERHGIAAGSRYTDAESLIRDPEVDAVLSITPNDAHYEIIRLCLKHGKPLMTEKPFTRTYEEAASLKRLAAGNPTPCMVGFSYRYVPAFRMAREWIRDGRIGPVRHLFVQYLQQWGGTPFETKMNWRLDRAITGTGTLGDLGSHMVDAARFLVGEPTEVASLMRNLIGQREDPATGAMVDVDIDDFAAFTALLAPGIPAVFQTSRNAFGSQNQFEIAVYGDVGTLHMNWEEGDYLTWIHRNAEGSEVRERIAVPARFKLAQMQDFIDLVRDDAREERPTLYDGYMNQKILEAVVRSSRERRSVRIEELDDPVEEAGI